MGKTRDRAILNEKDRIGDNSISLNNIAAKQDNNVNGDSPLNSQPKWAASKWTTSPRFSPTGKKTKRDRTSQSNKIDVWLNKPGERKGSENEISETENQNTEDTPKSRPTITNKHSHTNANTTTNYSSEKETSQSKFKETTSIIRPKKRSERKTKNAKEKSHSHQRELETYCPTNGEGNLTKESKLLDVSSNSSENSLTNKKFKRILNETEYKKTCKNTKETTNRKKSNTGWLSKAGEKKDKRKDRSRAKYTPLPVKIDSDPPGENLEKSKIRERNRSRTVIQADVRESFRKQESLYRSLRHMSPTSVKKIACNGKKEEIENKPKARNSTTSKLYSTDVHKENCDTKIKSPRKRKAKSKLDVKKSVKLQKKLDNYILKNLKPDDQRKFDSSESYELPTFKHITKKAKKPKIDEFSKKYGMIIPSVEEILKEQKDLEKYKQQIESFEAIEDRSFELPFSVKDLNKTQECFEDILGCTHLSIDDITEAFKNNLKHISDIFQGKKYNERHDKFFNKTNSQELYYSTSMIVFNFDQKEHMITLLKNKFDPDDKWTPYFFQVLLPELCLRIFMNTHGMTYDEAVKYLDTRPIVDD